MDVDAPEHGKSGGNKTRAAGSPVVRHIRTATRTPSATITAYINSSQRTAVVGSTLSDVKIEVKLNCHS